MLQGEPGRREDGPAPAWSGDAPLLVVRGGRVSVVGLAQQASGVRKIDPYQEVGLGHGQPFREP